jgi:poly(3-hydroxybutyrate) depolymerase
MARRIVALSFVVLLACWSQAPGRAETSSLPAVRSGKLPGPAVLYAPAPKAPQLENRNERFEAEPLLIAGTDAYRGNEYLYQDYIYDDWGADTGHEDAAGSDSGGDLEYPTNAKRYAGNAADLVEFRISAGPDDVLYRITLNTLLVPDSTIVAIAFNSDGKDSGLSMLPGDPGANFPGTDEVISAWGTGAVHARATLSGWKLRTVKVTTDRKANQMTITVPRSVSNPKGIWRTTVATGLYDAKNRSWLKPMMGAPTEDTPGGASPDGSTPAIFNLGFRMNENPHGLTPTDAEQSNVLKRGDATAFARAIDFRVLNGTVLKLKPQLARTGTMVRIFPSRMAHEGGKDFNATPETRGQLQQYSLYVPKSYRPSRPAGLTLMLHSLGEHNWQYNGSKGVQQVGEQRANLVLSPEARGEDGWYQHEAEYDVFEAWNDAARRYTLDPDRTYVSGYSMGGYGTYRFGSLWPDLFARAFSTVGPPAQGIWVPPLSPLGGGRETNTNVWLENTRNVPFLNVVGMADELVPYAGTRAQNLGAPEHGIRGFEQLGYRYRFVTYPTGEHFTIAVFSYDTPYAVDFLGSARVNRSPRHVTFSYAPLTDHRSLGLVHDHAYWVSDVRLADPNKGDVPKGTVDAVSFVSGLGDPAIVDRSDGGVGPIPYFELGQDWGDAPVYPRENSIKLELSNVRKVRVDAARAGIDPRKPLILDVYTSDGATIQVSSPGPDWTVRVDPGHRILRLR